MTSERSSKSHAWGWTISILAVPVLYVLTLPLVVWTTSKVRSPGVPIPHPLWLQLYLTPYRWTVSTPMEAPLEAYYWWVMNRLGKPW